MGWYLKTWACDRGLLLFVRFSDLEGEQSVRVITEVHIGRFDIALLVYPDYGCRLFGG